MTTIHKKNITVVDLEIQAMLRQDESVLGYFIPNKPVMMSLSLLYCLILFVVGFTALSTTPDCVASEKFSIEDDCSFAARYFFIAVSIILLIKSYLSTLKKYIITDQRVLFRSGILGTDFNSVYFDKIQDASVNVGVFDKIFSTGTITLNTASSAYMDDKKGNNVLQSIDSPYEVYNLIQGAINDFKRKNKSS